MMKIFLRLLGLIFLALPVLSNAQSITVSPNNSDFCSNTAITYTSSPPAPGNDIMWQYADYSNYAATGTEMEITLGFGTVLNMNGVPMSACPGGAIRAIEVDPQGNYVYASTVHILSSVGNLPIPVYTGNSYPGNCYGLSVPPCFDPFSTIPWTSQRWSMWYKNGVATGISSFYLSGPLTDSAWYEYKVRLTCGDTITTGPFYVWQPSAPVISAQGATTFCTGDTVILQASTTQAIQHWTLNGTLISGSANKTSIKATQAGVYTAVIKGFGNSNCYLSSNAITITVNPGAFITSATDKACNGDSVLLTCTAASSYLWKRNGAVINGANTQSIWVKSTGNYSVLTTGLTCNSSFIKPVTFYATATVNVSPNGTLNICKGAATTLSASGSNITTFQWFKNGDTLSGGILPQLTPVSSGNYKCVVSNVLGCTKTSSVVKINIINNAGTLPVKKLVLQPASDGKDAYVTSAFGQFGTNFGTASTMEVSNWYKYFRTAERGFLDFDLSSLPPNSPVVSATLKIWIDTVASKTLNYPPNSLLIKRCLQPWQENTVVWNSGIDSSDFLTTAVPCSVIQSKSFLSANVTNQLKHWSYVPAERFGFYLQLDEYKQLSWLSIASSDNSVVSHHPKLTVNYYYADIIPGGPLNLCTGGSVTFTTNTGPYSYQWYKNGIAIAGAGTSSYTASTTGSYFVMLTDAAGCAVFSQTKAVTINGTPLVNLSPAGSVSFCQGSTQVLTADSLAGYTFQWKKNNVNIAGATLRSYSVSQAGTYSVVVTSNCGVTAKDSVVCTVINNPAAVITAGGPVTFCAGQSVTLTANTYNGVSYQWRRNGNNISGATSPSYVAGQQGTYTVKETANGCTKTSNGISVTVNCRLGEEEVTGYTVEILPQPVRSQAGIHVYGEFMAGEVAYEVADMQGRSITSFSGSGTGDLLNVEGWSTGVYLLRTYYRGELIAVNKLLVAR